MEKIMNAGLLTELHSEDMLAINGGGFWGDLAYAVGATVHFIAYAVEDGINHPIRPSEYR
jgi:hypothetical protein